jgi:hypothetical protein
VLSATNYPALLYAMYSSRSGRGQLGLSCICAKFFLFSIFFTGA